MSKRITNHERILRVLMDGNWHCWTEFGPAGHKAATRVSELNARGFDIRSRPSPTHKAESGRALQEYRLGSAV